jgi:molybdopterin/thiamine biosynthesis adenylyltransferase
MDISRHRELFDPEKFNLPVHIIGVGATGSWLALSLAKLGVRSLHVWDFDKVEEHNVPNQAFGTGNVGMYKVDSARELFHAMTDSWITIHNEAVTNQPLSGIVYLMVDSMKARKEIWDNCLKYKPAVKHVIEPRMGLNSGRVYNVNPVAPKQIAAYEGTYYSDDAPNVDVSACGTSMTVISSAMHIAAICTRQLINFVDGTELDNEILIDFKFNGVYPTRWA